MKKYKVIYADPPWAYKVWSKKGAGRSAESHYPTMDIAAIKALPVGELADKDCALFLWITFPMLREAWGVMDAWGFTFKTVAFVWIKQCRKSEGLFTGMGYWTRANAEICLLATRGRPKRAARDVKQVILSHVERHSQKPEEARRRIEALMGDVPALSCSQEPHRPAGMCGEMRLQAISGLRKGCEPLAYVTVPKDLTKIKSKMLFGLTKRQLVCFGSAALAGVPLFFLSKGSMGTTPAALCMILVMLPFFLFALYEKNGQTPEALLGHLIQCKFTRPKKRVYQTNNAYSALEKQAELERTVGRMPPARGKEARAGAGSPGRSESRSRPSSGRPRGTARTTPYRQASPSAICTRTACAVWTTGIFPKPSPTPTSATVWQARTISGISLNASAISITAMIPPSACK